MKYFHFGFWSNSMTVYIQYSKWKSVRVSFKCSHFKKMKFNFGWHYIQWTPPRHEIIRDETVNLRMPIFYQSRIDRSKDKFVIVNCNKCKFDFISPARKTNVNRSFYMTKWNFILVKFNFGSCVNTLLIYKISYILIYTTIIFLEKSKT